MNANNPKLKVSSPGRIVLFGEHSDYLGLTVIPAAINLRLSIEGFMVEEPEIRINFKDLKRKDHFFLTTSRIKYRWKRDYVRAATNIFRKLGGSVPGFKCNIRSNIPIGGGLSSSSALVVAWIGFLNSAGNFNLQPEDLAQLAFEAEVLEFKEAGGMMDHYTSAIGGLLSIDFSRPLPQVEKLSGKLEGIIIGDSKQRKKDTVGDIMKLKAEFNEGLKILKDEFHSFDLATTPLKQAESILEGRESSKRILSAIKNRDITYRAMNLLKNPTPNPKEIGSLINKEHNLLRDELGRSTPKIERMITKSLDVGALGCKINGSGGGGCMIAYAPDYTKEVAKAIESEGGKAYIVQIDSGFKKDN